MKDFDFPIVGTKLLPYKKFDLNDPEGRAEYFEYKAGAEIKKLREYLNGGGTFVAYLLGKKSSGKGTYAKMFAEAVAGDKVAHFSVGDMIRSFDETVRDEKKAKAFVAELQKEYRGFISLENIIERLQNRSTKTLLPTEIILALAKREIAKLGKKAIFIDGFPRDLDQVSYSLFFRDLIGYRDDPDVLVMIDVPSAVIDERIKFRVVCPLCQTSRNVKLLPTKNIAYDEQEKKCYLLCDNPNCPGRVATEDPRQSRDKPTRMVTKEGDEQGIGPIQSRLEKDEMLIKEAMKLQGIPKILLRNSVPAAVASEYFDDYELTPSYEYSVNPATKTVQVAQTPWQVNDDQGVPSNSLTPPPVVVALIKQLASVLDR